jgi:hypothetical protein
MAGAAKDTKYDGVPASTDCPWANGRLPQGRGMRAKQVEAIESKAFASGIWEPRRDKRAASLGVD